MLAYNATLTGNNDIREISEKVNKSALLLLYYCLIHALFNKAKF